MVYEDFTKKIQSLPKRTASHKVLRDKVFNIAKPLTYDRYQRGLASMVCKFFDKNSTSFVDKSTSGNGVKSIPNQQLAYELHKPFITKF